MNSTSLLARQDVMRRLRWGRTKFYRELPKLKKAGLFFFPIADNPKDLRVTEENFAEVVERWRRKAIEKAQQDKDYLRKHGAIL